jgi:hypothetical protein
MKALKSFDATVDGGKLIDDILQSLFEQSPEAGFKSACSILQLLRANMTLTQVDTLTNPVGRDGQANAIGQAVATALLPSLRGCIGGENGPAPPSGLLAIAATNGQPDSGSPVARDDPPVGSATFAELAAASVDLINRGATAAAAHALVAEGRHAFVWFEDAMGRFSAGKPGKDSPPEEHDMCDICTQPSPEWRCAECPRNRLFCTACWVHVHTHAHTQASTARPGLSLHQKSRYGGPPATKVQTWKLYKNVVGGCGGSLDEADARARNVDGGVTYDGQGSGGISIAMGALAGSLGSEGAKGLLDVVTGRFQEVCTRANRQSSELPPGFVATVTYESSKLLLPGFRFGSAFLSPKQVAELFMSLRQIADECNDTWKDKPLRIVLAACFGTRVAQYLAQQSCMEVATFDGPHPSSTLIQTVEVLTSCSWDLTSFVHEYNETVLAPWKGAQPIDWQAGGVCQSIKGYVLTDLGHLPVP